MATADCTVPYRCCVRAREGRLHEIRTSFQSVFQRKPAPDLIRVGDRFASRKRVKSKIHRDVPATAGLRHGEETITQRRLSGQLPRIQRSWGWPARGVKAWAEVAEMPVSPATIAHAKLP